MEFLDEESRPRLLFQSRSINPTTNPEESLTKFSFHKPTLFISLPFSLLLFFLSLIYFKSEPLQSIFFWLALSFLIGPFAPSSITAGDIRVGRGPLLRPPPPPPETEEIDSDLNRKQTNRRSKAKKQEEIEFGPTPLIVKEVERKASNGVINGGRIEEEREWSDGDLEILKKQMVKNPVGKPGRWEAISEAFNGRHGVESVIKTAKSLGEKKVSDSDSFNRFLKDRKPVDKRVEEEIGNVGVGNGEMMNEKENTWSSGEDIALLNALKAFPKDVAMRWEKITAAVPGKTKAACMKRVSELKKDFRSSKGSSTER